MASTAPAYRNSDDSGSAKERPFFTVADIENFFETCPPELLSRRFRHFLRGCWIAAGRPFGSEILLFKANEHYRRACYYRSERTVRYNRLAAEKLNLLEVVHTHHGWIRPRTERDQGLYRRVTTHRLPTALLLRWRNGHHAQAEVTPIRKPAAPAEKPLPPAPAAPQPARKTAEEKPRQPKLTRRESAKFVGDMAVLMKGCTRVTGTGLATSHEEGTYALSRDDSRYRPKMNWREALAAVSKAWRREPDSVIAALKFWGYTTEPDSS